MPGPIDITPRNEVLAMVDRALAVYDAAVASSRTETASEAPAAPSLVRPPRQSEGSSAAALERSARRFGPRAPSPGFVPEGAPLEERPVGATGSPTVTGGAGGHGQAPSVREATVTVNGRQYPVVITRGEAQPSAGHVVIGTHDGQTAWARSVADAGEIRRSGQAVFVD